MLRRPLRRRAGFSLVEVMVAVFIVSAGLIALLTLFPLGAIQMGQALRDDRSQQCALQADGKIRELWRARVIDATPSATDPYFSAGDPFYSVLNYYDDADGALLVVAGSQPAIGATRRASYPVILDPVGDTSYTLTKRTSVAGANTFLRRPHPLAGGFGPAVRMATLPDDMEFAAGDANPAFIGTPADGEGIAMPSSGSQRIFRAGRYNWAAVIQRPDNSNRLVADLKLLVFDRRAPGVNPPDNEIALPNATYPTVNSVTPGQTQVTLFAPNDVLGLRVGSWVMDGTGIGGVRNANFYRVTSLDADTVPTQVTIELHIPIVKTRGDVNPTAAYNATFYLFRELIDVYDRPQLAPSGYQKQTP